MNYRVIAGTVLILLGAFVFMNRGGSFEVSDIFFYFWPSIFIIPLGVFFHWLYFGITERRDPGYLVPGGLLLTVGIVCQISMLYDVWDMMWPGFILAPAVGLFELYWFGGRPKGLLIPINILTVIALLFFAVFSIGSFFSFLSTKPYLAIAMIVIGAILLFSRKKPS